MLPELLRERLVNVGAEIRQACSTEMTVYVPGADKKFHLDKPLNLIFPTSYYVDHVNPKRNKGYGGWRPDETLAAWIPRMQTALGDYRVGDVLLSYMTLGNLSFGLANNKRINLHQKYDSLYKTIKRQAVLISDYIRIQRFPDDHSTSDEIALIDAAFCSRPNFFWPALVDCLIENHSLSLALETHDTLA